MESEEELDALRSQVSRYSILVGFILILVFVLPCVLFALLAKYCQKQPIRRKVCVSTSPLRVCVWVGGHTLVSG